MNVKIDHDLKKEVDRSTHSHSHHIDSWSKWFPITIVIPAAGVILSYLVITSLPAVSLPVPSVNDPNILQGSATDAARLTALAEFFAAKEAAGIQRGKIADAARYTAMAMFYASK